MADLNRIVLLLTVAAAAGCSRQSADRFPSKPIELVIAFPPGGVTDLAGRVYADGLSKELQVPVVPVNRAGGSGVLGATTAAQARKDGYTLLANSVSGMVLGPAVMKNVSFAADRDFVPVAALLMAPNSLIVNEGSAYRTLADLIAAGKQRAGGLKYGTAGTGTDGHFNAEVFLRAAGIQAKHVPFGGGGELASAVMGGHVDFGAGSLTSYYSLVVARKVRTLALTGTRRLAGLSDVPTFAESGLSGDFVDSWAAVFAPAGTPQPVVDRLLEASGRVTRTPQFAEKIQKMGGVVPATSPGEFLELLRRQQQTAAAIAARIGLVETTP